MDIHLDTDAVHRDVGAWYAANARDLPWRRPPYAGDPYAVLVSEVMLQQTQVERAKPKFIEFMDRFPTFLALAEAEAADVIRMWAGMGYNNRAVRLHRLAAVVAYQLEGSLPSEAEELRRLPGIGPYTAAAVACFAYGASVPVLDTNVYRVLSRLAHGIDAPSRKALEPLAEALVPRPGSHTDPSTWHQALMDIGATLCTVARPRCMLCPLRSHCAAAPVLQAPSLQNRSERAIAEASVPYVPKQGKFEGSPRFYRGRVVKALRELSPGSSMPLEELGQMVYTGYDDDRHQTWLIGLAERLVAEGLARWVAGGLALP
jgi:A/G-specific adenine glycosylase